jgi:hypothetical protein
VISAEVWLRCCHRPFVLQVGPSRRLLCVDGLLGCYGLLMKMGYKPNLSGNFPGYLNEFVDRKNFNRSGPHKLQPVCNFGRRSISCGQTNRGRAAGGFGTHAQTRFLFVNLVSAQSVPQCQRQLFHLVFFSLFVINSQAAPQN